MKKIKQGEYESLRKSRLKHLIKKYSKDSEVGGAINVIIEAENNFMFTGLNFYNEQTDEVDHEAIDAWEKKYTNTYIRAIKRLKAIDKNNPDIFALIAWVYSKLGNYRRSIKFYQQALEFEDNNFFWEKLLDLIEKYASKSFKGTKFGKEISEWSGNLGWRKFDD